MATATVPVVGSRGKFNLTAPFTLDANREYTCVAVRNFTEVGKSGVDIYATFYAPRGLAKAAYEADAKAQALIVVLLGDRSDFVYVPSSYIASVPDSSGYNYTRRLYNLDLGMMYTEADLSAMMDNIKALVQNMAGVIPVVTQLQVPVVEVVTPTAHATIEAGRQGQVTNPSGYEQMYRTEKAKVESLLAENQRLAAKLIELGVVSL